MNYFVVKYTGPFGYLKPWTAVRDGETFSQQFLTHGTLNVPPKVKRGQAWFNSGQQKFPTYFNSLPAHTKI